MDEEELEAWAEQWGVSVDEAEDILEAIALGDDSDLFNVPLDENGRPDPEAMRELSDELDEYFDIDISVHDLYDLYYGYTPGES